MNLEVKRFAFGDDSTLGKFFIDGELECFTLEDERRNVKVAKETCIPPGTYRLGVRHNSPMYRHFDDRWPWHSGMLHLLDVPGFTFVYIHPGNTDEETDGCLLVGVTPAITTAGEFQLTQSRDAYAELYQKIRPVLTGPEIVTLTVTEVTRGT